METPQPKIEASLLKVWTLNKADQIFSKVIRKRDPVCIFRLATDADPSAKRCNNKSTQNSHYWGRGNKTVRYDFENCDGICGGCHMNHEGSKQGLYTDIKKLQLGEERFIALEKRARSIGNQRNEIIKFMTWCLNGIVLD